MKPVWQFMLAALCCAAVLPTPAEATESQPNILFILMDDLGYGEYAATSSAVSITPEIDRIAAGGLVMTRFYSAAPVCSPSRAAFFTGRYPARDRFVTYLHTRAHNAAVGQADFLPAATPNLARTLKAAGYATGHFGKWHLGGGRDVGDAPWPAAYGFDESFTSFEGLGPRAVMRNPGHDLSRHSAALGQGPVVWRWKHELTETYTAQAASFIGRNRDRPWFVQLWLDDPHDPYQPSAEQLEAEPTDRASPDLTRYRAVVRTMDRQIGELVRMLDEIGERRDTLIVITSDNGPVALERYYRDGATPPGSTSGLRGRKWSLYEGGIRQSLVVNWPGRIAAGRRDEETLGNAVDLHRTLAAAAGAQAPQASDGIDLLPVWSGKPLSGRPDMFWAVSDYATADRLSGPFLASDRSPPLALRSGQWKLLADGQGRRFELYDLQNDPAERTDLSNKRRALARQLRDRLMQWRKTLPN